MKEGLDADDIWVMVEDEFHSTAQLFTRHLHRAEYQRLKRLAKSQNASSIQQIQRPVDARTLQSTESRKKMEGNMQRAEQASALRNIMGVKRLPGREEDEKVEDDPWMRDPRLMGLMTQRENSTQLARIAGVKSKTKASAGYSQSHLQPTSPREEREEDRKPSVEVRQDAPRAGPTGLVVDSSDSDSDDLGGRSRSIIVTKRKPRDSPPSNGAVLPANHPRTNHPSIPKATTKKRVDSFFPPRCVHKSTESDKTPKQLSTSPLNSSSKPAISDMSWEDLDGFPKRHVLPSRIMGRALQKAQETAKQEEVKRRRSLKAEEIPTFLF